ncbi:MAG: hypothetical protein ACYDIA_14180 [Candidatus Humimicrobiaceae bacterium]
MERYKDLNTQLNLAKVFRAVISAGLVAPVFVSVSACEKKTPAAEVKAITSVSKETIPTITAVTKMKDMNIFS